MTVEKGHSKAPSGWFIAATLLASVACGITDATGPQRVSDALAAQVATTASKTETEEQEYGGQTATRTWQASAYVTPSVSADVSTKLVGSWLLMPVVQAIGDGLFERPGYSDVIDMYDDATGLVNSAFAVDAYIDFGTCHLGQYNRISMHTQHMGWALNLPQLPTRTLDVFHDCNSGGGGGATGNCRWVHTDDLEISFDGGVTWQVLEEGSAEFVCSNYEELMQ